MSEGWIDAHCHLADPALSGSVDSMIERAQACGIARFIQGGVSPPDWQRQLQLGARYPGAILRVFGIHPWWVMDGLPTEEDAEACCNAALIELAQRAQEGVAVGEIGLDFSHRP